jgi:hypothetical protein
MTSPIATGGRYVGVSPIQARFAGSSEIQRVRTSASPSPISGTGSSTRSNVRSSTRPVGRSRSTIHIGHGSNPTRSQTTGCGTYTWANRRSEPSGHITARRPRRAARPTRTSLRRGASSRRQGTKLGSRAVGSRGSYFPHRTSIGRGARRTCVARKRACEVTTGNRGYFVSNKPVSPMNSGLGVSNRSYVGVPGPNRVPDGHVPAVRSGSRKPCRHRGFRSGETRTRTGDTTIFSPEIKTL